LFFRRFVAPTLQDGRQTDLPQRFNAADYVFEPAACPRCHETYRPAQFDDRYTFALPAGLARGDLVRGEPVSGGSPIFGVLGSATASQPPTALLECFFALQNEGKDVTLMEAERELRKRPAVMPKPATASKPSESGRIPGGVVAIVGIVLFNLLRGIAQHDSPHYQAPPHYQPPQFQTPMPKWTQPDTTTPDFTPYLRPLNSAVPTLQPGWTAPGFQFPPKSSASPTAERRS
jgi:hypothetical protein